MERHIEKKNSKLQHNEQCDTFFFKVCVPMHRKGPGGNTSNHGQSFLVGDWERWIKERNPYYFLSIGFCWDVL